MALTPAFIKAAMGHAAVSRGMREIIKGMPRVTGPASYIKALTQLGRVPGLIRTPTQLRRLAEAGNPATRKFLLKMNKGIRTRFENSGGGFSTAGMAFFSPRYVHKASRAAGQTGAVRGPTQSLHTAAHEYAEAWSDVASVGWRNSFGKPGMLTAQTGVGSAKMPLSHMSRQPILAELRMARQTGGQGELLKSAEWRLQVTRGQVTRARSTMSGENLHMVESAGQEVETMLRRVMRRDPVRHQKLFGTGGLVQQIHNQSHGTVSKIADQRYRSGNMFRYSHPIRSEPHVNMGSRRESAGGHHA